MKNNHYKGQVIPFNRDNIDTDLIIPKQYLKSIKKSGFGPFLFDSLRYTSTSTLDSNIKRKINPDFILNKVPYKNGKVLISKSNFGCGSSREHAVWAIQNYGIDAVIAESFADIFFRNSYKNGLLLIKLDKDVIISIIEQAQKSNSYIVEIDLEKEKLLIPNGKQISFVIDKSYKDRIMFNLDDIEMTLQNKDQIRSYEEKMKMKKPWLFDNE